MSWNINITSLPKKAQQWLYFLWKLRRAQTPIMHSFYRSIIERESCPAALPLWYGSCIISCRKTLQGTVRAAEKIIGVSFPSLVDMYHTRFTRKAAKNCTWPHRPISQSFQPAAVGNETTEYPNRNQHTERHFFPPGSHNDQLSPYSAPTPRWLLLICTIIVYKPHLSVLSIYSWLLILYILYKNYLIFVTMVFFKFSLLVLWA